MMLSVVYLFTRNKIMIEEKNKLSNKQEEFNSAMDKYNTNKIYQYVYKFVSILNVSIQIILFVLLFQLSMNWYWYMISFMVAYFITDFINGLVHMYMDNNDNYNSIFGPFIASFHLHHKQTKYKNNRILVIYFNESGSKFWLVPYLLFTLCLYYLHINPIVLITLIYIGILSSIAEVSHYLCHNSHSKIILFLQKSGILLSKKYHSNHHKKENEQYAFLNGMSDYFINFIANKYYNGYKNGTDKDFKYYNGVNTANR